MKSAEDLIKRYTDWLKENITPRQISDDTIGLDSPFLDRHNDFIQIYIVQGKDTIRLSDDGATIEDLRMDGFEFNSELRRAHLKSVLSGFGVAWEKETGELYAEASLRNFPAKKHALIQTILAVNDMYVLSRPNVRRLFHEEVADYLQENDIRFLRDLSVTGRSGLMHKYDFIIPPTKKAPERFLRPVNTLDKNQTRSILFAWDETSRLREDARLYVVSNDTGSRRSASKQYVDALEEYGITHAAFSELNVILDVLAA